MPWDLTGNKGTNPTTNFLGATDNQPLIIRTNNTEKVRVTSTGNVGIGTTNPARTLEIAASTGSTELVIRDNSQATDRRAWRLMNNSQVLSIEAVNDTLTGGTNLVNFTRAGNVGIGTKNPVAKLHLEGGGIRWGNGSVLTTDQGGSIELGGDSGTPGAGTPYIDFHFRGLTQDFNARIINDADGQLSVVASALSVTGDVLLPGADCAEDFDVLGAERLEPGSVMVIDEAGVLRESSQPYDKRVAGVISGGGDYRAGLLLDRQEESKANRMPVALMGKVACKVEARERPIEVGDLLTTAPTPGYAMKANDPSKTPGAVIGKALQRLAEGRGLIGVLVSLQ